MIAAIRLARRQEVAAKFDVARLFGDFGKLLGEYGWSAGGVFDVPRDAKPGGLAWFIRGSSIIALGRGMAQCADGRIWRRLG